MTHQHQKQRKISDLLAETPIEIHNSSRAKSNRYENESNIDDEVNRIINKVMSKSKPIEWLGQSSFKRDAEKSSKIDKINRELLNENAGLIG